MNIIERKTKMIEYLQLKTAEQDWHGVSDAANDLREIDLEIKLAGGSPGCKCGVPECPGSGAA